MIDLNEFLTVAVRAWTVTHPKKQKQSRPPKDQRPREGKRAARRREAHKRLDRIRAACQCRVINHCLIFDTETTVDETQALLFGALRYAKLSHGVVSTVAESLIGAD